MLVASEEFKIQLRQYEVRETVNVDVMCYRKEVLVRENQYNVSSDAVLNQELPSLGDRIVIVQHPSIPFGSQGTVVKVDPSTLWLEVMLDTPSYSGVSVALDAKIENCVDRCV